MCGGASSQQKEEAAQQQAFSQQLMNENQTQFGQQQGILQHLTNVFSPILQAGPSQQGFSAGQVTAMNTGAMDSSSNAYQHAEQALNSQYAAAGGGNEYVPSGAQEQANMQLGEAGAAVLAGEQNKIVQENYAQGNQNFNTAASALSGNSYQLGSIGATADAATGAGKQAFNAATGVNDANNALMNTVIGSATGALAGAATGGWPGAFGGMAAGAK
jgi:hypothetical protein